MNSLVGQIKPPLSIFLADKIDELERAGKKIAKVHNGEPYIPTPDYIKSVLIEELANNNTDYCNSQGLFELRDVISTLYNKLYGKNISNENVIITSGGVHAIYLSFKAILNIGDEVAIVDPSWPQYGNIAQLSGANVVRISTLNSKGRLTVDLLKKHISSKTKLIVINNPCNPTGVVYSKKEIDSFLEIIGQHKELKVLFDEVYNYYDYSGDFCSVLGSEYYDDVKERIIYINSFSKSYSMTGWRLGYAITVDTIIKSMLSVSQNMITCVPPYNQIAGAIAIKGRYSNKHIFDDMLFELKKRKTAIQNTLDARNIKYINPDGAFYFFIDVGKDSMEASQEFLERDNIALVPGLSYGVDFNSYLRFCFAVDEYSYAKLIEWLENVKI